MKKILCLAIGIVLVISLSACGGKNNAGSTDEKSAEGGVMTHEEYVAAALDSEVTVETYVQAKQSWWDGKATFYTAAPDGAYFIYEMPCTGDEYEKLTVGTKIRVTGKKSEWSGEIEITNAKFEIIDGNYIAEPVDITGLIGTEKLDEHQNELVKFSKMTVEPKTDKDGNESAYFYGWDGSGKEGDDLYFDASSDGKTVTFTVESYLCGQNTEVYKAVKELQIGKTYDLTGFLYWYNGANPHIVAVTPAE